MSLNDTVSAERVHIAFYGMRNAGKSSLVNAVTGQSLSVVSEVKGTTTDPVRKAMELLPLGPVVIIDTPGLDDEGELGGMRVQKARETLSKTDIAVLVVDGTVGYSELDRSMCRVFDEKSIPYIVAQNKCDLIADKKAPGERELYVSAVTGEGIYELKERLGAFASAAKAKKDEKYIVADLLPDGAHVVLVVPVDESAPKGRLILPQQQVMRELLDTHRTFSVCQPEELTRTLSSLREPPAMVITDSQAFERVARDVPELITLTSFSILFARYKGDLDALIAGADALSKLCDGDRVLISEGCTHHRQCNDIGTVKLPKWIESYTGKKPAYSFTSGGEFPDDLSGYRLVVHCGGCMLNEREMKSRIERAASQGVPIVNYGVTIAQMKGILARSLRGVRK